MGKSNESQSLIMKRTASPWLFYRIQIQPNSSKDGMLLFYFQEKSRQRLPILQRSNFSSWRVALFLIGCASKAGFMKFFGIILSLFASLGASAAQQIATLEDGTLIRVWTEACKDPVTNRLEPCLRAAPLEDQAPACYDPVTKSWGSCL